MDDSNAGMERCPLLRAFLLVARSLVAPPDALMEEQAREALCGVRTSAPCPGCEHSGDTDLWLCSQRTRQTRPLPSTGTACPRSPRCCCRTAGKFPVPASAQITSSHDVPTYPDDARGPLDGVEEPEADVTDKLTLVVALVASAAKDRDEDLVGYGSREGLKRMPHPYSGKELTVQVDDSRGTELTAVLDGSRLAVGGVVRHRKTVELAGSTERVSQHGENDEARKRKCIRSIRWRQ